MVTMVEIAMMMMMMTTNVECFGVGGGWDQRDTHTPRILIYNKRTVGQPHPKFSQKYRGPRSASCVVTRSVALLAERILASLLNGDAPSHKHS